MSWALFVLLVLAAWRSYVLTARDSILDGPRRRWAKVGTPRRTFLECVYCAGFWWAGIWAIGWSLVTRTPDTAEGVALTVGTWWAVAAGVVIVENLVDLLVEHSGS